MKHNADRCSERGICFPMKEISGGNACEQHIREAQTGLCTCKGLLGPLRAIHALVWGLKFLPAFPLEQHPAASPLKYQGGRGSAQSPPLGGWPALAGAAGALTQPQPGRCPPSRAWAAPSAPRAPGRHAPQRALGTASPAAASVGTCSLRERPLLSLAPSCDVWSLPLPPGAAPPRVRAHPVALVKW
ncbi:cortexin domain-containing 1 protein isoform X1 [Balaenoptera ricei]|uniref:cortexin domain-containing 1 protein isoform X1 n=1 Tax=Balaenoptera ricei TaxID=2746895 RepID=UPI0028BF42E8|nr:cortexin domain-containing 1 protein isoform X1 [Balaenoptera ricei]